MEQNGWNRSSSALPYARSPHNTMDSYFFPFSFAQVGANQKKMKLANQKRKAMGKLKALWGGRWGNGVCRLMGINKTCLYLI